jgi:hypothetical protein
MQPLMGLYRSVAATKQAPAWRDEAQPTSRVLIVVLSRRFGRTGR